MILPAPDHDLPARLHMTIRRMSNPLIGGECLETARAGAPLSCFVIGAELFGFGQPYERGRLPNFPRREPVPACAGWRRRLVDGH